MPVNPEDADLLKKPFGTLIPDSKVTKEKVSLMLRGSRRVIAVGDATTERLVSFGIIPDIAIIDGRERRSKRRYPANYRATEMKCFNAPGTISAQAMTILQDALRAKPPIRVIVDGEEDMLAIPLFGTSPLGSTVLYGQPLQGLVVVKITHARRKKAKDLMDRIGID